MTDTNYQGYGSPSPQQLLAELERLRSENSKLEAKVATLNRQNKLSQMKLEKRERRVTLRLRPSAYDILLGKAREQGITLSDLMGNILEGYTQDCAVDPGVAAAPVRPSPAAPEVPGWLDGGDQGDVPF